MFKDGLYHGKGTLVNADGSRYVGEFADGKPQGMAEQWIDAEGNSYKGEVYNGKPQGYGAYSYVDGSHYEGDFVAGEWHGEG